MNHSWKDYILTYPGLSIINSWFSPPFTTSWLSNCRMELRRDSTTPALPRGQGPSGRMMKGTCFLVSHLIDSTYIYIYTYIYMATDRILEMKISEILSVAVCIYIYICLFIVCVYIYVCIYVYIYMYICVCVYIYMCVYMCIYVCICVYMCIYV